MKTPYIVAELSGNHRGDLGRALALIDMAAEAGVDAVKLQTYTADTMTIDHDSPDFRVSEGLWAGRTLYDLYGEANTPWEWHPALFTRAQELGIGIFSSPFDMTAIDLLESLDVVAYKVASFEVTDLELLRAIAATGKPVYLSTGMATRQEVEDAVEVFKDNELTVLHCVSGYPTPVTEANLSTIQALGDWFRVPIGLSDHTLGINTALAATAIGVSVIEKHVTLCRADGGPDAAFSLEPAELRALVTGCREVAAAIGLPTYGPTEAEKPMLQFRRSIYVVRDIDKGEKLTRDNIRVIRPGHGLPPSRFKGLLGTSAFRQLKRGEPLTDTCVSHK